MKLTSANSKNHVTLSLKIASVFFLFFLFHPHILAQEILKIEKPDGSFTKRTGTIVDWTGLVITLESGSRERKIDSTTVTDIQTDWPGEVLKARKLFAQKQFESAINEYQSARASDSRKWVQQIIASELVQVFDAMENPVSATQEFLRIYSADSETRFFDLIPLPWSTGGMQGPADAQTATWIDATDSLLRLLGASWRLSGTERSKAISVLEDLTNDTDKRIAQLATTQLWRTQMHAANLADTERWQRQMDKIIPGLRAGPLVVLAATQNRLGETDQAQINLLKIPILYPEKKSLVAFALYRCGSIMNDNNADEDAENIWRELIREFPAGQYTEIAKSKLK